MTDLKLLALDGEDLDVISATTQDAIVRVPDMGYAEGDRRFALLMNRYAWELGGERGTGQRKRAALSFSRVGRVSFAGINLGAQEGVLELLDIRFEGGQEPAGVIELRFAGGGTIRLDVECIEARLEDLGAAWAAKAKPEHRLLMPVRLDSRQPDFAAQFAVLLGSKHEASEEVGATVASILDDVRQRGDAAVIEYTNRFDHLSLTPARMRFSEAEIEAAGRALAPDVRAALETAHARILSHHERQRPLDDIYEDDLGVTLGTRWTAIEAVGIYVPGGTASYPSSVLMNAVPAKVAGVERVAMVVPTPRGEVNNAVLVAASIAGVTEIYRIGGAQAVGALAYGTETIAPVIKIIGPGNAYVAAAKRQVFGMVGIDMIAGPSEVLVIADSSANPAWVAADLLAQTEHGGGAQGILVTTDPALADAVEREVVRQIALLPRAEITGQGWRDFGAVVTVRDLAEAAGLANRLASEHVELALDVPRDLLPKIRNAGAIFLGHHTPEAIGDYVGGSNHVLPTARTARFASGLGVLDFMKRTSILGCGPSSLAALAQSAITLARTEGLEAHGRSVAIRLNR